MAGLVSVGYFLLSLFFSLLIFVLWARIALCYFRVSLLHPISQVVYRITNLLVRPFAELYKYRWMRLSRYDWHCVIVLIIVEFLKFMSFSWLLLGFIMPVDLIILYVLADLIVQPCDLLFYAILIRVIMSWINPYWQHPFADFIRMVTEPLLGVARRLLPDIAGFDFSPIIVILLLKVITLFISASIPMHLI